MSLSGAWSASGVGEALRGLMQALTHLPWAYQDLPHLETPHALLAALRVPTALGPTSLPPPGPHMPCTKVEKKLYFSYETLSIALSLLSLKHMECSFSYGPWVLSRKNQEELCTYQEDII